VRVLTGRYAEYRRIYPALCTIYGSGTPQPR
jgi:hypothetical protein